MLNLWYAKPEEVRNLPSGTRVCAGLPGSLAYGTFRHVRTMLVKGVLVNGTVHVDWDN